MSRVDIDPAETAVKCTPATSELGTRAGAAVSRVRSPCLYVFVRTLAWPFGAVMPGGYMTLGSDACRGERCQHGRVPHRVLGFVLVSSAEFPVSAISLFAH